jgi:hypothetical protein
MRIKSALLGCAQSILLVACTVTQPDRAPVTSPAGSPGTPARAAAMLRPGIGVVESASVVSLPSSSTAAAGGTSRAASGPTMAYRLKMADGSTQDVVQAGERFELGDRVQVTSDGRLVRP